MVIDETERLIIREIEKEEVDEAAGLLTLFNENDVKDFTKEMVEAYIDLAYGFYGYGYYGLYLKATGELVGIAGFREGSCPLEIGYCIKEEFRRLGLASEAVKSLVEFAEEDFLWVLEEKPVGKQVMGESLWCYYKDKKVLVYGKTKKDNKASERVLEKNGFVPCEGFVR